MGRLSHCRGRAIMAATQAPAGDLNITVSVRPDPLFERDGYNVLCEVPLTFMQAALGDEVVVPTIDGKVKYTVPEGTQPGTVFRLRNKGIPYVNGREPRRPVCDRCFGSAEKPESKAEAGAERV